MTERGNLFTHIVIHECELAINIHRYSKDTRRSCVVLAMHFVRILNLRGSRDRPSDRVPIALGQVSLTMAQVMNQIRKRVEKLDQLTLNSS